MGQAIEVESVVMGDVVLFDTDRSITGQDGEGYTTLDSAKAGGTSAGALAERLLGLDSAVDHVFVLSNTVSVRRNGGWSDEAVADATAVIRDFFIFYDENRGSSVGS